MQAYVILCQCHLRQMPMPTYSNAKRHDSAAEVGLSHICMLQAQKVWATKDWTCSAEMHMQSKCTITQS